MNLPSERKRAIVVAGGKGLRMGGAVPKQFRALSGAPVLFHTLCRFYEAVPEVELVVVLPAGEIEPTLRQAEALGFLPEFRAVPGGTSRFQSVREGVRFLQKRGAEGLVAVHDGVRPFVSAGIIKECYRVAAETGAAVAAVKLKDSLREVASDGSCRARDRSAFRLVQTPQTFRFGLLAEAFEQPESAAFTDDATVCEAAGHAVTLVEGGYDNAKLTTPEDWPLFERLAERYPLPARLFRSDKPSRP